MCAYKKAQGGHTLPDEILRRSYFIFLFKESEIELKEIYKTILLKKKNGPIFWAVLYVYLQ